MQAQPSALFIGAANLDRNAALLEPHRRATSNRATVTETAGGVTLNIASRFAACGGSATLVTRLGDDAGATMIRRALDERGVTLLASPAERTGTFISILQPDGELVTAISDMAALESFEPTLPEGEFDWTFMDSNLSEATLEKLANAVTTPLALASASIAKAPRLLNVLPKADVVFVNIPELSELSGGAAEPFQWFRERTAAILVASDGARPLWLMHGSEISSVPIIANETIVDVVGAGDALAGTVLYGLASGMAVPDAIRSGMEAAARTVQVAGPYLPPDV